jgi:hypothetical protein
MSLPGIEEGEVILQRWREIHDERRGIATYLVLIVLQRRADGEERNELSETEPRIFSPTLSAGPIGKAPAQSTASLKGLTGLVQA